MKRIPKIFLSYNPGSEFEETLAIRLHTIGAVNGFNMLLPDRNKSRIISEETKTRIRSCDYFIVFATNTISKIVKDEIVVAFEKMHDKSKILVIIDRQNKGKIQTIKNCTSIIIDSMAHSKEEILSHILKQIKSGEVKTAKKQKGNEEAVAGVLLAGLALLILGGALSKDKK